MAIERLTLGSEDIGYWLLAFDSDPKASYRARSSVNGLDQAMNAKWLQTGALTYLVEIFSTVTE